MVQRFAVIGNPIAHSLSPVIHQYFAQQTNVSLTYEKIKGDELLFEQQVIDFFSKGGKGLNITLPFKQRAFALAKVRTPRCQLAGAANTLWMHEGQLHADNTDGIGLIRDLTRYMALENNTILLLGAGGAARGIIPALLATQAASIIVVNRSSAKIEELLGDFPQLKSLALDKVSGLFDLVINATSASLEGAAVSLPLDVMAQKPFCYDLAYRQYDATPFVDYATSMGCNAADGLGMLVEQAAESFYVWYGLKPSPEALLPLLRKK